MTKSIIKFKPTVDVQDKVLARDKGWYCQSPDKDDLVLLTEYDHNGGFHDYLAANSTTGDGIPAVSKIGYVAPSAEMISGNLGNYDAGQVYIMLGVTGGSGAGANIAAAKDGDYAFEVGIGLNAAAKAIVAIYEWDATNTKPTKLVASKEVHNATTSVGWATEKIDVALVAGKHYCVGILSVSGSIIEKTRAGGMKKYPLVGGKLPVDVTAQGGTGSGYNVAAYVSVAKYS